MNSEQYVEDVKKLESLIGPIGLYDGRKVDSRIVHAIIGLTTESGELQDAIKKNMFYGAKLDLVNHKEEAGDVLWYLAVLIDALGTTFEEVSNVNISKLKARYPDKFDPERALNRNLDKEREILENE